MTRYGETEADDVFRADAEAKGYLKEGGRGLRAYYSDHGMIQPEAEREIHEREFPIWPRETGEDGPADGPDLAWSLTS